MSYAQFLLLFSCLSNISAYSIYLFLIFKNRIKPHPITYLVWSLVLCLNFSIQIFSGVGLSSILLGLNAFGCTLILCLCLAKGYRQYDKIDLVCLSLAVVAIGLWVVTKQPLYSALLSSVIDILAIIPSFRKTFHKPFEDSPIAYWTSGTEYFISLPSYGIYSFAVLLYPITVLSIDFIYATFIFIRRLQLKKSLTS